MGSGRVAALACASQNAQRCCAAKSGVGPILPGDSVNGVSPSKRGQAGRPPPLGSPLRAKAPQYLQRVGKCVLRNANSGATNLKYAPLLQPCPCAECILRIAYGTTDL